MAEIAGLKLIVPSSVAGSGVSVSASGKVTFTAATTINVNGVFSATYDNYVMIYAGVNAADGEDNFVRLRASGTDATGSNYTRQVIDASSTSVIGNRETTDKFFIMSGSTNRSGYHLYLYGPALSQATAVRSVTAMGLSGARIIDVAGTHSLSTAYDGFTVYPSGGTNLTGTIQVFGLSQ